MRYKITVTGKDFMNNVIQYRGIAEASSQDEAIEKTKAAYRIAGDERQDWDIQAIELDFEK